ncbi:MAG: hypothetical protein HFF42_00675 [Lawsonibacter sp.]|jgi:hypothetical protein|nr:hypothetical protein [Lawsonibacter sp.]
MFWTVLLLIICFSAVASVLFWMLAMMIGEWALAVAGVLLLAGVITALVSAYQRIAVQLDSVEKKLDKLLEQKEEE